MSRYPTTHSLDYQRPAAPTRLTEAAAAFTFRTASIYLQGGHGIRLAREQIGPSLDFHGEEFT
jgi:hypothetical protein